ncbi:MAG TPA: ATP-binding protein [Steroidobacteraceae bacterium]|nr:ATP-binding protein [Steroidobacteraceae bacterium]
MPESGASAADFRLLADALPHLVWVCRPDGTLDYLNHRGSEYFGAAVEPSPGPFLCGPATHPEDDLRARSAWERAIASGDALSFETRLRRHDGRFHWHLTRAQPVRSGNGTLTGWMGTSTNVHDAKEANDCSAFLLALSTELAPLGNPQELLCAAMGRLRERLGAAEVSLAELDESQGEAVMLRQRASDASQIEIASLPLRPFENLATRARLGQMTVMRDVRDQSRSALDDSPVGDAPLPADRCGSLYDRWFGLEGVGAVVSAPLLQGGALLALLSVVEARPRDWSESEVTLVQRVADIVWPAFEKARADRAVEEALREVNQRKDEFLAMLGHELRNPLAPITSAAQILRIHAASHPEIEWARAVIDRQTRHLARLVDDLLDVSRIVRGQIVLHREELDLAEIVTHGVETSRPLIRARNHRLHVQLPRAQVRLPGDLTRLAQVLANLLNNAAKYTDEGGEIWLDACREGNQAVLRVRDTGAGIPATLLPRVFELFAQAERTLDRSQGGLGIGLTLVKLLVEMHGGSVEARSDGGPGEGAEFIVRLPSSEDAAAASFEPFAPEPTPASQSPARATAARPPPARRPPGALRILIVDDNVDAADSTAMLLGLDGYETHSVHSARAALEVASSISPDVVLLDIGLPEMDGYEVARRLRSLPQGAPSMIVALTGYGQPADRERASLAGFDEFLVKPVKTSVLNGLLRSIPVH